MPPAAFTPYAPTCRRPVLQLLIPRDIYKTYISDEISKSNAQIRRLLPTIRDTTHITPTPHSKEPLDHAEEGFRKF